MRRADRLFQIVQFLRSRRITTAAWLAEMLEVSERTIYRDIRDLMATGVPIEGEAGVGYVIRGGYDLPPLMFDREEISALTLGARIVTSWTDPALGRAAQSALSKIETVLPAAIKRELDATHLFSPMVRITPQEAAWMAELRGAIDERQKAFMAYSRADGTASTRTVWPLGLFFWGNSWTLGAWCELRGDFRNFRLDRIDRLKILGEHYPRQRGRTLEDLIARESKKA